ncbi:MAG TPA: nucleotide exchange factor GrpE [Pyrinomonadaceae bacterium]
MDPNQEIDNIDDITDETDQNDSVSVDDFIKQLEAKEKDLHITSETTIIEIAENFDDGELPDFLKADLQPLDAQKPDKSSPTSKTDPETPLTDALEKEIAGLKEQLSKMEADRQELFLNSQRRAKDFENYKARTERERKETFQTQVGNLATQMLPALDNLNRAVDFALAMPVEQRDEIQQFFDGIVLVNQQVNEVLAEMGIQPIATVGETFDPHFHEAVATEYSDEFGPNIVSAELLRGYRIGDRVIRHSMVKVARPPDLNNHDETAFADDEPAADPDSDPTSSEE